MSSAFCRSCLELYLLSSRNVANIALLNLPLHFTRNANPSTNIVYNFGLLSPTNCIVSLSMVVIKLDICVNGYCNIFDMVSLDLKLPSIVISILLLSASILSLLVSALSLRETDICICATVDSANN